MVRTVFSITTFSGLTIARETLASGLGAIFQPCASLLRNAVPSQPAVQNTNSSARRRRLGWVVDLKPPLTLTLQYGRSEFDQLYAHFYFDVTTTNRAAVWNM